MAGRNAERGQAIEAELCEQGTKAKFITTQLESEKDCQNLIQQAERIFKGIDVLINAAGATTRNSIFNAKGSEIDTIFSINVRAPIILMSEAIQLMRDKNTEGSIVNVSSVVASGGPEFLLAYSASKAALEAATKNVAYAVVRDRIRVNAIAPGWIDTPGEHQTQITTHQQPLDWLKQAEETQPFKRLIKTNELARAIGFIAGPASGLMTGSIVHFDQSIPGAGNQPIPPMR